MSLSELVLLYLYNTELYYWILLGMIIVGGIVIKKNHISIIDPFFMAIISCICAYTIPFFLYKTGYCSVRNFWYFTLSESVFWISFFSFKKTTKFKKIVFIKEKECARILFYISLVVYLYATIYTYTHIGIPLFMRSRLELYENTGLGFLGRFTDFASFYLCYYTFHEIITMRKKKYILVLGVIAINLFLSGSKGAILILLTTFFVYYWFYLGKKARIKWKYILLVIPFPILVLMMQAETEELPVSDALSLLGIRLMAYGDVYLYAYPNDIIDQVKILHPFYSFLKPLLAPLRLMTTEATDNAIGLQLFWTVNPSYTGMNQGPNARMAIMGWCYFKWLGILFSAFCGWLLAFILYRGRKYFPHSFLGICIYGYLYNFSFSIITDFSLFLGSLATLVINLLFYGVIVLLLLNFKIRYRLQRI